MLADSKQRMFFLDSKNVLRVKSSKGPILTLDEGKPTCRCNLMTANEKRLEMDVEKKLLLFLKSERTLVIYNLAGKKLTAEPEVIGTIKTKKESGIQDFCIGPEETVLTLSQKGLLICHDGESEHLLDLGIPQTAVQYTNLLFDLQSGYAFAIGISPAQSASKLVICMLQLESNRNIRVVSKISLSTSKGSISCN